jgi:hypothetical protein
MIGFEGLMKLDVESLQHVLEWIKAEEKQADEMADSQWDDAHDTDMHSGAALAWDDARGTVENALQSKLSQHKQNCICAFCEANPDFESRFAALRRQNKNR